MKSKAVSPRFAKAAVSEGFTAPPAMGVQALATPAGVSSPDAAPR